MGQSRSLLGLQRDSEISLPGRNPLDGGFYKDDHVPHMSGLGTVASSPEGVHYATVLWTSRTFYERVRIPPSY